MSDIRLDRLNAVLSPPLGASQGDRGRTDKTESFISLLDQEINKTEGIRISKHAQERLESRGITLGPEEMHKLEKAVALASQKGVNESLVMMNSLAFVVSVPAKTVVTAMPAGGTEANIFTNIDGAVIL